VGWEPTPWQTTIGDLDIVVVSHDPRACAVQISTLALLVKPVVQAHQVMARLQNGMTLEVQVCAPATWGATLAMYTGNDAHRVWLQKHALHHGFTLDRDGLYRHGVVYDVPDEVQLYALLGMAWIPPELREYYVADVAPPQAIAPLLTLGDMQGDLHMHTTWSDGNGSIAQTGRICPYARLHPCRNYRPWCIDWRHQWARQQTLARPTPRN
jgi:DNA polymerase (family 10)